MKSDTCEELKSILNNLCEERNAIQSQIDENNLHIKEMNSIDKKMQEREDDDFRIFSPRKNKDTLYREELEQSNAGRTDYETQNDELVREINRIDSIIQIMQKVLEETEPEKEQTEFSNTNVYESIEHLSYKIELSMKFIRQDPDRAKQELLLVNEKLQEILQHNTENK